MKVLKFMALGMLAVLVTGCCNCNKKSGNYAFQETVWELTQLNGRNIKADDNFTLAFLNTGRIAGRGACNNFFGPWETVPGKTNGIKIGNVASTLMACPNMDLEDAFLKSLETITEYRIDDGKLYLYSGSKLTAVLKGTNKRLE